MKIIYIYKYNNNNKKKTTKQNLIIEISNIYYMKTHIKFR